MWFTLLGCASLSLVNAFTFLTPLIGFALGVALFGERLGVSAAIGLSVAGIGVLFVERGGSPAATQRTAFAQQFGRLTDSTWR